MSKDRVEVETGEGRAVSDMSTSCCVTSSKTREGGETGYSKSGSPGEGANEGGEGEGRMATAGGLDGGGVLESISQGAYCPPSYL